MSSSIIEAKFQQLDRTIKLLKRSQPPKVASSDQLRQLVYSQRAHLVNAKSKENLGGGRVPAQRHHDTAPASTKAGSPEPVSDGVSFISNQDVQHQRELKARRPPSRPHSSSSTRSSGESRQLAAARSSKRLIGDRKWVDPKQQRAEQILDDTWNVRDSSSTRLLRMSANSVAKQCVFAGNSRSAGQLW